MALHATKFSILIVFLVAFSQGESSKDVSHEGKRLVERDLSEELIIFCFLSYSFLYFLSGRVAL